MYALRILEQIYSIFPSSSMIDLHMMNVPSNSSFVPVCMCAIACLIVQQKIKMQPMAHSEWNAIYWRLFSWPLVLKFRILKWKRKE